MSTTSAGADLGAGSDSTPIFDELVGRFGLVLPMPSQDGAGLPEGEGALPVDAPIAAAC